MRQLARTWSRYSSQATREQLNREAHRPKLEYSLLAQAATAKDNLLSLDKAQNQTLRIITGAMKSIMKEHRQGVRKSQIWKKLYQKNIFMKHYMIKKIIPISQTNCFFEMPITKLRENEYIVCEGILSEYECKNALDQMSSNKSP